MKRIITIISCVLMALAASAQIQNDEVSVINVPGDGSLVVRATGSGRNRVLARKDAPKKAMQAIIFKGLNVPGNANLSKPLIRELGAQEKYEDFFYAFFAEHGPYTEFYRIHEDRKFISNNQQNHRVQNTNQVTLRIERAKLKAYLTEQGIIK